jgi:hypothetical protein
VKALGSFHWLDLPYFLLIAVMVLALHRDSRRLFGAGLLGHAAVSAGAGLERLWFLCGCSALLCLAELAVWLRMTRRLRGR